MTSSFHTRPSLLVRLRDAGDRAAWGQFVELYAPLVYRFARRRGLQDADAADLTQDVLKAVAGASARLEYDPGRGTFRGWLFTVARNLLNNFLARQRRRPAAEGGTEGQRLLEELPAPIENEEALWQQEYEQRLFDWAAEQIRGDFQETTWQAFWRTAVEGENPRTVAAALALSVGAVYVAKSRVLARLRKLVQEIIGENELR
jgi:RNA polymerase sigma-70 factor (ECF subfamily)